MREKDEARFSSMLRLFRPDMSPVPSPGSAIKKMFPSVPKFISNLSGKIGSGIVSTGAQGAKHLSNFGAKADTGVRKSLDWTANLGAKGPFGLGSWITSSVNKLFGRK